MNNNKVDEGALLGVFQKTGYITIGTSEKPLGLVPKEPLPERWKAKQFATAPPRLGKTPDVFFEKKYNYLAEGDKYMDKGRYAVSQHEQKWVKQAINCFNEAASQGCAELSSTAPAAADDGPLLYDLVFEKASHPKSPACSRTHRDTKNITQLSHERHLGGSLTTNHLAFTAPTIQPSPHTLGTGKQLIRDTFYRKTNIMFPPGCDSTTQ